MRCLPIAAIIAVVSTTALTQIASAADQGPPAHKAPVYKAPPLPPAPVYSWTGWYVGGDVGYSWGDANTDLNGNGTVTSGIGLGGGPGFPFPLQFTGGSATVRLKGAIGGAQVGYNYQVSSLWVLGFETDFQISGERGSGTFSDPFSGAECDSADPFPPPLQLLRLPGPRHCDDDVYSQNRLVWHAPWPSRFFAR